MRCDLPALAEALYHTAGLTLARFDLAARQQCSLTDLDPGFTILLDLDGQERLLHQAPLLKKPELYVNSFNAVWMGIPYPESAAESVFVLGPILLGAIAAADLTRHLSEHGQATSHLNQLVDLYYKVPVMPYTDFLRYFQLIYFLIFDKPADLSILYSKDLGNKAVIKRNADSIAETQKRDFKLALDIEHYILDCVRQGDLSRLEHRRSIDISSMPWLAKNNLRSTKNMLIVAISTMTRAAIEGGLPVETAFPLSDMIIMQMEALQDIPKCFELYQHALLDFTARVRNNKLVLRYSKVINQCCSFIVSHLDSPLKVSDVALHAGRNVDALNRRFHRETGLTIADYILTAKINEAKMLLLHSDLPLVDIANQLAFSSQSQFSVAFKKCTGSTPNSYRKNVIHT